MTAVNLVATPPRVKRRLRIKHLQEKYDVSRQTIWKWAREGILPKPKYLGSIPYWDEDEADAAPKAR
jgi:predicted DNA-binding transcriptional regulator AlpA